MALPELTGGELAARLTAALPAAVAGYEETAVWVHPAGLAAAAAVLKEDPELDLQFLNSVSAVDFVEHFDLVYHLTSLRRRHTAVMKARLYGREDLTAPSVYGIWRGADFQEREIWDLMGVRFEGHPNMKRIMLWEGFDGHPLRKDFL